MSFLKRISFKRVLITFLTLVLLGVITVFLIIYRIDSFSRDKIIRQLEAVPSADAILVLGAKAYSDNTPSPALKDRLEYGYTLYMARKAPKIIVSGDHGTRGYDEVNTMLTYLLNKGVPRADIFLDHAGFDTYDSFYRARDIFCAESLLISTQEFHMPRSVYVANRLGIEAYGYPCPDEAVYNMQYQNFREALAKVKAFLDVEIFKRKPKFLGEEIPLNQDGIITNG